MKNLITILFGIGILFSALTAQLFSQGSRPAKIGFSDCEKPRFLKIYHGQTFIMECDSAIIYNSLAWKNLAQIEQLDDSLASLYTLNRSLKDSIIALKDSVHNHLYKIIAIQDSSYNMLRFHFDSAAGLVTRSTKNTERALDYIDQVKRTSVITGGLLGAVTGGVVGGRIGKDSQGDFNFSWTGAGVGLVLGAVVDWLLIR